MFSQVPDLDVIVASVSMGGMAAGIGVAAKVSSRHSITYTTSIVVFGSLCCPIIID